MNKTFGFIGTGNMGGAVARAVAKAVAGENVFLCDSAMEKAAELAAQLQCNVATADQVAAKCDYIVLGVKPQMMAKVLGDLAPVLAARKDDFVLVSMAAGLSMAQLRTMAGKDYPVIRIMPNIPVAVGCGMVMYDTTENVTGEQKAIFVESMAHAGKLDALPEQLIDAGSAVAGCGPAFAAMFLEALADGGVACGLPRQKALDYAAQMLLGSVQLIQQTGQHPGQLKDAVCSPGGSTIAGVAALERGGLRAAAISAVEEALRRTKELGK